MPDRPAASLPPELFLDTSYVIALLVPNDEHHDAADALAAVTVRQRTRLITTHAVLLEIGNAFAKPAYRATGVRALRALESDAAIHVLPLTAERYARALGVYEARADQAWGLTDCTSFVVMRALGLSAALTADRHFVQAGFRALLREQGS